MSLRIGSLCTGYGGLDMAVQEALGGEVAWVADPDPGATRILAHHYPDTPNLGDITRVDWSAVPTVDVITAGFPCQDISNAGKRAGIDGSRSGVWTHVVEAVRVVRPRLVYLENVAALTTRGLDRVTATLAALGYVGSWRCLRASDVGAPHRRERVFIAAWPADSEGPRLEAWREGRPGGGASTHPAGDRGERPGPPRGRRPGPADDGAAAADPAGDRRDQGRPQPAGFVGGPDAAQRGGTDWGPYAGAIARWEHVLGRPAPAPTRPDGRGGAHRLSPRFVEWLMGLPSGWVTGVPGLSRAQQLRALGNGVVPAQGAAALSLLLGAARAEAREEVCA